MARDLQESETEDLGDDSAIVLDGDDELAKYLVSLGIEDVVKMMGDGENEHYKELLLRVLFEYAEQEFINEVLEKVKPFG